MISLTNPPTTLPIDGWLHSRIVARYLKSTPAHSSRISSNRSPRRVHFRIARGIDWRGSTNRVAYPWPWSKSMDLQPLTLRGNPLTATRIMTIQLEASLHHFNPNHFGGTTDFLSTADDCDCDTLMNRVCRPWHGFGQSCCSIPKLRAGSENRTDLRGADLSGFQVVVADRLPDLKRFLRRKLVDSESWEQTNHATWNELGCFRRGRDSP